MPEGIRFFTIDTKEQDLMKVGNILVKEVLEYPNYGYRLEEGDYYSTWRGKRLLILHINNPTLVLSEEARDPEVAKPDVILSTGVDSNLPYGATHRYEVYLLSGRGKASEMSTEEIRERYSYVTKPWWQRLINNTNKALNNLSAVDIARIFDSREWWPRI